MSDAAAYRCVLAGIIGKEEPLKGPDLLKALGLETEAAYFKERIASYEKGNMELYEGESNLELFLKPIK